MIHGHVVPESHLTTLAKEARLSAGVSQTEAARQLGVSQPAIASAETTPKRNLTQLRLKMISRFSGGYESVGPYYIVKRKADRLRPGDEFL